MLRFRKLILLGLSSVALALPLRACPICLGITLPVPTLAEDVMASRDVVLARAAPDTGAFDVQDVIKGASTLRGTRVTTDAAKDGDIVILTRRDEASKWKLQGLSTAAAADFARQIAALLPVENPNDAAWIAQLEWFRPFLAHADDRLARSAWRGWAGAPYRLFKAPVAQIPRAQLREWIAEPSLAAQRNLWIVLLGINGNAADAAWLEEGAQAAWRAGDETSLAALLTALVAQRGAAGVDFIEQYYIRDRERTLGEVQSGLAALGLHGREGSAEMRKRVVEAYRVFVAERKPLAGFVARDLAAWQQWDFAPAFEAMLQSSEPIYPATRMAMIEYLRARPAATR